MRTSLMVGMSSELKEEIGVFAQQRNLSVAQVVRAACAGYIGYDLEADELEKEERRGRPKVYGSREERREASRERAKKRRALTKKLLADHMQQDTAARNAKFAESVAKIPESGN